MTITTRTAAATGTTAKGSALTTSEVDANWNEFQGKFTSVTIGGTNTYTGTLSQVSLTDGYTFNAYFTNANTSTVCTLALNGGSAVSILTGEVAGMLPVTEGLKGFQRLRYSSAASAWVAVDQLSHYITTALASNQIMPLGHTFVYDMNATSINLRVSCTAGHAYRFNTTYLYKPSLVADSLLFYPTGATATGQWTQDATQTIGTNLGNINPITNQSYSIVSLGASLYSGIGTPSAAASVTAFDGVYSVSTGSGANVFGNIYNLDTNNYCTSIGRVASRVQGPITALGTLSSATELFTGRFTLTRIS